MTELEMQTQWLTEHPRRACELETAAANRIKPKPENEPTRSILYLSAASLAIKAGDKDTALELINKGLAGFPNVEVKRELMWLKQKQTTGRSV